MANDKPIKPGSVAHALLLMEAGFIVEDGARWPRSTIDALELTRDERGLYMGWTYPDPLTPIRWFYLHRPYIYDSPQAEAKKRGELRERGLL